MLVSSTSINAARDTTTAISHGFTGCSNGETCGAGTARMAMNGSTLASAVAALRRRVYSFSQCRASGTSALLLRIEAFAGRKATMNSWTGIRHEPGNITRIAEGLNRLENSVERAGFPSPPRISRRMPNLFKKDSSGNGQDAPRATVGDRLAQFEKRQRQLWRVTYFLLALLTIAYVIVSWDTVRSFARRFDYLLAAGPGLI